MTEPSRERIRETFSIRVHAPRDLLWEEMQTVDLLLPHIDQIVHSVVDDSKLSASVRARVKWGPFGWNVDGVARVEEITARERLAFTLELPGIGLRQHGVLDAETVSVDETNLTFTAEVELGRLAKTAHNVVDEGVEAYVRMLVTRLGARAERHWLGAQRLQQRLPHAGQQ